MFDLHLYSDEDLSELAKSVIKEQDARLPLDPQPWYFRGSEYEMGYPVRDAFGPGNDGHPYPNGQLSVLSPRVGYRQDKSAYDATVYNWAKEIGLKEVYRRSFS